MILKSLELHGFKSFVDPTRMDFNNGFTAVVGPNGCGKSNISDAIRWVIGEQSSKNLRGTKSSDLIFNGSEGRKPVNRTEITLTLGNVPSGIRIANVPHVGEEIRVTRCYHRSGESEFYINQVPCRLKDITDLFLDLGISPKVLTIIEQTHIHNLISSKPEDRRILIEEAAGILKFKHRRDEALRKLDSSGQNLERIGDIVQELGRQVESLKRQAAKAERYKTLQGEVKELSLHLFSHKIRGYRERLQNIEAEYKENEEEKVQISAQISTLDNELSELRIAIDEMSAVLKEKKETIQKLTVQIGKDESSIELKRHQIDQANRDNQAGEEEVVQMREEIERLNAGVEHCRSTLSSVSEDINAQEALCQEKTRIYEQAQESLRYKEEAVRLGERQILGLFQSIAQKKNDITALTTRIEFLEKRGGSLRKELDETLAQISEAEAQISDQSVDHESAVKSFQEVQAQKESLKSRVQEARESKSRLEKEHGELRETFLQRSSLLNSLTELRNKFEGYQEGVKALMAHNTNGNRIQGLREVLVDVLQTPEEFETAFEAVLGEKLQSVIVESYSDSVRAIDYLNTEHTGRGSFVPMQPKKIPSLALNLNGDSGVLGIAENFVQCREEYRPILNHLLQGVVLVEDLETAFALHAHDDFHGTVVTRNGEVIDSQGVVSGGDLKSDRSGLLAQNREIDELTSDVENWKSKLDQAAKQCEESVQHLETLEGELNECLISERSAEIRVNNSLRDKEQLEKEVQRLEQKRSTVEYEAYTGNQELQELKGESESLVQEMTTSEHEKEREEASLSGLKSELESFRMDMQEMSDEIGKVKILLTSLAGKRENLFNEIKQFESQQGQFNERILRREQEKVSNTEKIAQYNEEIAQLEQTILDQAREKDRLVEETVKEDEILDEKQSHLKESEAVLKTQSHRVQELSELISQLDLKRSELKIQCAHLGEKAFDDFNVTLDEMLDRYREPVEEEAEMEEQIRVLKDKVGRMGEVNLAALSDFEKTNERYSFLKRQEDDLTASIESLRETIEKINQTTRQRFLDTFHEVNESFKTSFTRLFQGGRAELILLDPESPLESGIDIMAQPRGKKNQSITLLSQGEKAMTAVALMFSIFRVRPSPFCLLDEVDAPLDEANVIRFQDMLRELSDNTQFILITHNQKTMSFADILYGVTMEERGVSKVVSVNLN